MEGTRWLRWPRGLSGRLAAGKKDGTWIWLGVRPRAEPQGSQLSRQDGQGPPRPAGAQRKAEGTALADTGSHQSANTPTGY